jgi:hypothetical protein
MKRFEERLEASEKSLRVAPKKVEKICSLRFTVFSSVADPDPGSGAFLTPGSGIRNRFFPDPGSQDHIFKSFLTIFLVKSSIIL